MQIDSFNDNIYVFGYRSKFQLMVNYRFILPHFDRLRKQLNSQLFTNKVS